MSKKTRKKSSKPTTAKKAAKKAVRAQSARSAKTAPSKTRGATAATTSKTKSRQTGNATAKASHKAPSKKLKSSSPGKSAPRTIRVSKTTTTPAAGNPLPGTMSGEKPAELAVPRSTHVSPLAEGAKAPAFQSAARRRQHRLARGLCRQKTRAVFLSARGHAGLHQGGHRFHASGERVCRCTDRRARGFGRPAKGAGILSK